MLSEKVLLAINEQINREMYSAYLYLAMSSWCSQNGLTGVANWMRVQYQEEMFHAFKMYDYIIEQDGKAALKAIDQPPADFKSPLHVFEEVLAHEKKVTAWINGVVKAADAESDYATHNFMQWFVNEQVEEEANAKTILDDLKLAGDKGPGLFMINRELAQRVYTPPAAATAGNT